MEVPSPCVNICVLDADGERCTGCFRTLDEIADWAMFTNDRKRAVIEACDRRMAEAFEQ